MSNDNNNDIETRQERRQKRSEKRMERMSKHGKGLIKTYKDAILKRLRGKR